MTSQAATLRHRLCIFSARALAIFVGLWLSIGCATKPAPVALQPPRVESHAPAGRVPTDPGLPSMARTTPIAKRQPSTSLDDCEGGTPVRRGNTSVCVRPTSDAGIQCKSSRDCESWCVASLDGDTSREIVAGGGFCYRWTHLVGGCLRYIDEAFVVTLCLD